MQDSTFIIRIRHKYILDYNQNIRNMSLIKLRFHYPLSEFILFVILFIFLAYATSKHLSRFSHIWGHEVCHVSQNVNKITKKKSFGIIQYSLIKTYLWNFNHSLRRYLCIIPSLYQTQLTEKELGEGRSSIFLIRYLYYTNSATFTNYICFKFH